MSDFYEFEHECDKMPDGISFCKIKGFKSSQFNIHEYRGGIATQDTTFFGFRYCPYCGEDMEKKVAR